MFLTNELTAVVAVCILKTASEQHVSFVTPQMLLRALTKKLDDDRLCGVPLTFIQRSVRELAEKNIVNVTDGGRFGDRIYITEKGHDFAVEQGRAAGPAKAFLEDPTSAIRRYESFQFTFPTGRVFAVSAEWRDKLVVPEERQSSDAEEENEPVAPASDRVVRLDHNAPDYKETVQKLDQLIEDVRSSNDTGGEPEAKGQAVAELSAVRALLQATQVRAKQLAELASRALRWVTENVAKETVKEASKAIAAWLAKNLLL